MEALPRKLFVWVICTLLFVPEITWSGSEISPRLTLYGEARTILVEAPNILKLKMQHTGQIVSARLLGVGTPHNRDRIKHVEPQVISLIRKQDLWEVSRRFVEHQVDGRRVEIWTRKWDRFDDKHRLLAYVRVPSGRNTLDLNAEIIRNGYGFVTRDYVHTTFAEYRQLENAAKSDLKGMWSSLHGLVALKSVPTVR